MTTCKFCGKEIKTSEFEMFFTEDILSNMPCTDKCKAELLNKSSELKSARFTRNEKEYKIVKIFDGSVEDLDGRLYINALCEYDADDGLVKSDFVKLYLD